MAAISINKEEFHRLVNGETPVLVDFWAPWCGYCRKITHAYDNIAEEYRDRIVVVKINTDDEPLLSAEEQIEVIPTLVLYRKGESLGSFVAPESKDMIRRFLRQTLEL